MSNWTENMLTWDSLKCLPLLCYIHHHHHHHHRYKAGSITGPFSVWLIFKAWQKASWWDIKWTTWSGLVAISQQSQTKDPCDFWHIWCYDNKASALMKQLKNMSKERKQKYFHLINGLSCGGWRLQELHLTRCVGVVVTDWCRLVLLCDCI